MCVNSLHKEVIFQNAAVVIGFCSVFENIVPSAYETPGIMEVKSAYVLHQNKVIVQQTMTVPKGSPTVLFT